MNLSYYLKEVPLSRDKFMAATVSNGTLSEKEFLTLMNKNNPDYSVNNIKEVLKLMVNTAADVMVQGNSILISNFLKISPSVKGVFESSDDVFDSSKHKIAVNCTVSSVFSDNVGRRITVEKIKKPDSWPKIKEIYDNKTKGNIIQKDFANKIKTSNMAVPGLEFAGLLITCKADLTKKVVIECDQMDIIKYSNYELVFNIVRKFETPDWLINGVEILIQLRYRSDNGVIVENPEFETRWAC